MKIIRMLKTMAGPSGVFPAGQVRSVDDVTAAMLIGSEVAELVGRVQPAADPPTALVSEAEATEAETAAVEAAPEAAVTGPRKKVKK